MREFLTVVIVEPHLTGKCHANQGNKSVPKMFALIKKLLFRQWNGISISGTSRLAVIGNMASVPRDVGFVNHSAARMTFLNQLSTICWKSTKRSPRHFFVLTQSLHMQKAILWKRLLGRSSIPNLGNTEQLYILDNPWVTYMDSIFDDALKFIFYLH